MRLGRLLIGCKCRKQHRRHSSSSGVAEPSVFGPARVPSQESPEAALAPLQARGYTACELDFEARFWMDYDFAARFGSSRARRDIALSVHAPLAGFMGHAERGKKLNMAVGMLDHSAGSPRRPAPRSSSSIPASCSAASREDALDSVVEQLGELRARLEKKDRAVPFGVEVMGRVRELGTLDDVVEISRRPAGSAPCSTSRTCTRPRDGAFTRARAVRRRAREGRRGPRARARRSTSTSRTSSSRTATRRSTCRTAKGRCAPIRSREALAGFERPATVITESPDEASSQAIKKALGL